jgi:hypothetical protein
MCQYPVDTTAMGDLPSDVFILWFVGINLHIFNVNIIHVFVFFIEA